MRKRLLITGALIAVLAVALLASMAPGFDNPPTPNDGTCSGEYTYVGGTSYGWEYNPDHPEALDNGYAKMATWGQFVEFCVPNSSVQTRREEPTPTPTPEAEQNGGDQGVEGQAQDNSGTNTKSVSNTPAQTESTKTTTTQSTPKQAPAPPGPHADGYA